MPIKFSVVIPLYNKEREIREAIESVLNQTHPADEIIVVDDGSTDRSAEIVEKYFTGKAKLIKQKNQGVSAARNRGIKEARNEFVCLLDADDLWEENFLNEIKNLIIKYPDAVFYSTSYKIVDEKNNIFYPKIPFNKNFVGEIELFKFFKKYYGIINSSSVCMRKSLGILFPESETKGEDICVWIELDLRGKLAFSAKPLSIYRLNASNRSDRTSTNSVIPCQLKWLYNNKNRVTKDIKEFVIRNIIITVYGGFALNGNKENIKEIIRFIKNKGGLWWILLVPSLIFPKIILNLIKNIRRKGFIKNGS